MGMLLELVREWAAPVVLLLNLGFAVAGWLIRKTLVSRTDLVGLETQVAAKTASLEEADRSATQRLDRLEAARDHWITREDLMGLRLEMETMRGDMRSHSARIRAMKRQSAAEIATARALLERSERGLEMLQEFLLNQGK